jgi:hypothetical protein
MVPVTNLIRLFLILVSLDLQSCHLIFGRDKSSNSRADGSEQLVDCESSKELITAFNFLVSAKEVKLQNAQALAISKEVAKGCSGAARRFIEIVLLLDKAKISVDAAIKVATLVAASSDAGAETFKIVFVEAFLKDGLDLDALSALRMAKAMSVEYPGNPDQSGKDFGRIVKFFLAPDGLAMPRPQCGELAARITHLGVRRPEGIGDDYVEILTKLMDPAGANLATSDARALVDSMLEQNPYSVKNFLETYKFAIAPQGANLDRKDAVNLAKTVAAYRVSEKSTNGTETNPAQVEGFKSAPDEASQ